jgi:hypothetical protein
MKKLMMAFATFALAVASADPHSYRVTFTGPMWVGGTELKPGEYKVEMQGDKAVFKSGKTVVEVPAKMEENDRKYESNSVRINRDRKIEAIQIGGTKSRIVLQAGTPTGE